MVTRASRRAGPGWRRAAGVGTLAAVAVVAALVLVCAAPGRAMADENETTDETRDETPQLWEPEQAVAFLLGAPGSAYEAGDEGARPWNGALGAGITRALFGTYRLVLSSQDLPVCGFTPSCSRFSERAIDRCGPLQGALLSLDRLLRDHPLALPFYPRAADGHLKDDPDRYCSTAPE
jgi:putative component of membrane protein insertase Oxa1/YidC/SpoIIIJ protein YidD